MNQMNDGKKKISSLFSLLSLSLIISFFFIFWQLNSNYNNSEGKVILKIKNNNDWFFGLKLKSSLEKSFPESRPSKRTNILKEPINSCL